MAKKGADIVKNLKLNQTQSFISKNLQHLKQHPECKAGLVCIKPTLLRIEKERGPNKSQGKNSSGVTLKQWVGFQQQAQKEPQEQPLSFHPAISPEH